MKPKHTYNWDQLIIREPRKVKPTPKETEGAVFSYAVILALLILLMFIDGGR